MKYQKPFLKWVGGKSQIIDEVLKHFPIKCINYHELFLGGGSVLLALLSLQKEGKITIEGNVYAYDSNENLINLYKHVQNNKEELYKFIETYKKNYDGINGTITNKNPKNINEGMSSKESYYYWIRKKYVEMNKDAVESSALFLVLNKLCFRGLYREGPNGFNVPFGHYKNTPTIIDKDELDRICDLIQDVTFKCMDFNQSIQHVNKGDYVYLDPPYVPLDTKSFVSYTKHGFDQDMHEKLFSKIKMLQQKHIKFSMSNAKVKMVTETFENFNIKEVIAKRAIHSKNPGSKVTEVIVFN